jgi:DhnA family fructose-bisphosphate aldolase class Ia
MVNPSWLIQPVGSAMEAGARGCSVGRNIFQHRNPKAITKAIYKVFRGNKSIKEILSELRNT